VKSEAHVKVKDKNMDYKETIKKFENEVDSINSVS
jgi:hypothetical protein